AAASRRGSAPTARSRRGRPHSAPYPTGDGRCPRRRWRSRRRTGRRARHSWGTGSGQASSLTGRNVEPRGGTDNSASRPVRGGPGGPPRRCPYGVVVDSVNVSVLAYVPVRSGSFWPIVCLKPIVSTSLLIGAL